MSITIYARESGIETKHVEASTIQTHLAANDRFAGEAELLQAFLDADFEAPNYPETLGDYRLSGWSFDETEGCDVLVYERGMTFSDFEQEIARRESSLAPGNETPLLTHFVARMAELGGRDWRESEEEVPADEAKWWRRAYDLYEADRARPEAEQARTVQELFDRV